MKKNLRILAALCFLNLLWAPVNVQVAYAHRYGFTPVGIGLIRWLGIAVALATLVRLSAVQKRFSLVQPGRRDAWRAFGLGLLLTGPAHLIYYLSLNHIETLEGNVFNTTAPLWTALFAGVFLREAIDSRRWSALSLGFVGAYLTAIGFALPSLSAGHSLWNGMYLLGTIMESLAGVFLAGIIRRSSGLTVLAIESIGNFGAMLIAAVALPGAFPLRVPPMGAGWLPVAYLVFIAGLLAFGGWTTIVERAPISFMVVTLGLQAPLGAVMGYWFLGESIPASASIGGLLVCAALIVSVAEHKRSPKPLLHPE